MHVDDSQQLPDAIEISDPWKQKYNHPIQVPSSEIEEVKASATPKDAAVCVPQAPHDVHAAAARERTSTHTHTHTPTPTPTLTPTHTNTHFQEVSRQHCFLCSLLLASHHVAANVSLLLCCCCFIVSRSLLLLCFLSLVVLSVSHCGSLHRSATYHQEESPEWELDRVRYELDLQDVEW
jgi:hypothetical protein